MQIFRCIFFLTLLLTTVSVLAEGKKQHFIGFLEGIGEEEVAKTKEEAMKEKTGKDYPRQIRIMFYKDGEDWKTISEEFDKFPLKTTWTIAFDGKNLGELKGQKEIEKESDRIGFNYFEFNHGAGQKIISKGPIPTIGKRTFFTYLYAVHRPLVLNSEPYYNDPDGWKPSTLSEDALKELRQAFSKHYPLVINIRKPWPYKESDIKISKSYSAKTGWSIAGLHLINYHGEGPYIDQEDYPFFDNWFAISPTHEIIFLGHMTPLDAGDYDNTGKSAWIFLFDDDNKYGYAIFYDDFKKHAFYKTSVSG